MIGPGLAGLTAARWLAISGIPVVLLEGGEGERDGAARSLADADLDSRYYVRAAIRQGRATAVRRQYGPNDVFVMRFRHDLLRTGLVRIVVGATAVDSEAQGDAVRRVIAVRRDGARVTVAADRFVLAGGGVETVQTLLGSSIGAPGGPANRHDVVGRYVADHPEYRMGRMVPDDPGLLDRLGLYDLFHDERDGQMTAAVLTLAEEVKRAERLLNVGVVLVPQPGVRDGGRAGPADAADPRPAQGPGRRRDPAAPPRKPASVLAMRARKASGVGLDYPGGHVWHRGGWSRPGFDRSGFRVVELHAATEQTPDPANRLELGDRRDALGRQRIRARLHWSDADRDNLDRSLLLVQRELERAGRRAGRVLGGAPGRLGARAGGWHHPMGSALMHEDPRHGGRHGLPRARHGEPLPAGSCTFPTGLGCSNPTLMILAPTLRLTRHLGAADARTAPRALVPEA